MSPLKMPKWSASVFPENYFDAFSSHSKNDPNSRLSSVPAELVFPVSGSVMHRNWWSRCEAAARPGVFSAYGALVAPACSAVPLLTEEPGECCLPCCVPWPRTKPFTFAPERSEAREGHRSTTHSRVLQITDKAKWKWE